MSAKCCDHERLDEIQKELTHVLASTDFLASAQMTNFLRFIVHETLAGRENRIKERTIARHALDRSADFDPRLDCIVRVVAGKLRRALERYYAVKGAANRMRIEVPKGAYLPVFRRANAAAEVKTAIGNVSQCGSPTTNSLCAMGYPVVAVVPFVTFTRGERERFMADSIAEDISVRLSKFSWIQVIGYLITRSLRNKRCPPHELAAQLHADYFVIGSTRRNDDGYRVTVNLAHTKSAVIIWSGEFRGKFSGGRECMDTVVDQVVATVGNLFGAIFDAVWSGSRKIPLNDITGIEAVIRAMHYETCLSDESHTVALRSVGRAVHDHPEFAWGWAAKAALHVDQFGLLAGGGAVDSEERCRESLRRALVADPTCTYAHWVGALLELYQGHIHEAIEKMHRTLEYAMGSPFDVGAVGAGLNLLGEVEQGQHLINQAHQINPQLPGWIKWGTTLAQFAQGDYHTAIATTAHFSMPQSFWNPMLRSMALSGAGKMDHGLVEQAICQRPELGERPRELGSMLIKQPDVLDHFVDCVEAANLA